MIGAHLYTCSTASREERQTPCALNLPKYCRWSLSLPAQDVTGPPVSPFSSVELEPTPSVELSSDTITNIHRVVSLQGVGRQFPSPATEQTTFSPSQTMGQPTTSLGMSLGPSGSAMAPAPSTPGSLSTSMEVPDPTPLGELEPLPLPDSFRVSQPQQSQASPLQQPTPQAAAHQRGGSQVHHAQQGSQPRRYRSMPQVRSVWKRVK